MSIIGWVILGLIAGFVASRIVNAQGQGVVLDIVLGIVGAVVGGFIFDAAGGVGVTGFNAWSLLVAIIGSIVVLVLYHAMTGRRALLLTVLGGLAEFERDLMRARTGEGRRRAVEAGVKLGRRSSLTSHQQVEVRNRRAAGETLKALAKSYGVTHPTIIRTLRKFEVAISLA
jgi:uncharacterized membrane protein YeaQ/YmgE (transglycosylase-associated protein family)